MRVGAVNYLNAKPLIEGLDGEPGLELSLDLPSRLADRLAAGQLDVGLIPVIEYLREPGYSYIPEIAISSHGPVRSVKLLSRTPIPAIRTLALDEGSRTSATLALILLKKIWRLSPATMPLPMNIPLDNIHADALLLIGDRAMQTDAVRFRHCLDLGQKWAEWTGLPMVYALWAVRAGVDVAAEPFLQAKQRGLKRLNAIAEQEARKLGLDPDDCRQYLGESIRYDLGPDELRGLRCFQSHAADLGLAPGPKT